MGGYEVTYLDPPLDGVITAEMVKDAIREDTVLVSLMWANNEIGTINEIPEIGKLCKDKDIIFHTDATQMVGKLPINVAGVVGMGAAAALCKAEMSDDAIRLGNLRNKLESTITSQLDGVAINGALDKRIPHTSNISFAWVEGESLMMAIKEIAVSSGLACTSASLEPSYVLKSLGIGDDLAHSSLRFGLGRRTTEEEIEYTAKKVVEGVKKLRDLSPLYEMHLEGIDLSTVEWADH